MPRRFRRTLPLPPMVLFSLAALAPLPIMAVGLWQGGWWIAGGLIYMTAFAACLDHLIPLAAPDAPERAEFPGSDALLVAVGLGSLIALPFAIWAVAGNSGLSAPGRVAAFLGFGMFFGQVTNPAAHELIHRGDKRLFWLGAAAYASLLNGHHASAHRLVHHVHAATDLDPNSAKGDESFYRFLPRAYTFSFIRGLKSENALRARRNGADAGLHPYAAYLAMSALWALAALGVAGLAGLAAWAAIGLYATAQLMLSDYVQHYGLRRARLPNGKWEAVAARHSWNAPHWFSSSVMLNAPRHSDHHAHPARPYPALRLPEADQAPWLPWSLPVACMVALVPPLWRRKMAPRLRRWQTQP